jgi:hypothetical protein
MTTRDRVQYEVRKTLECLERMPKLEGNPFLYARVEARLRELAVHKTGTVGHRVVTVLKPALLFILVVVNIITLARNLLSSTDSTPRRSILVQTIVQEYALGPDPRTQFFTTENK